MCVVLTQLLLVVPVSLGRHAHSNVSNETNFKMDAKKEAELLRLYDGADCDRNCVLNEQPKTCYFEFLVESANAMGP